MAKRKNTSRRQRCGFLTVDAICASALLILLLGIVATSVVKVARGRKAMLQETVASQVVMNAAELLVSNVGAQKTLDSMSGELPEWAVSQLPAARLTYESVDETVGEFQSETDFDQPVMLERVRIRLSWDDDPGLPLKHFETVVWR